MKTIYLAAAAALALCAPALATPQGDPPGLNKGGDATAVGVGVGIGAAEANNVNLIDNRSNATGGNATATGGRADSSATVIAPVTTTDVNHNLQGQLQGQQQSSSSGVSGSGNSTNEIGVSTIGTGNVTEVGGQTAENTASNTVNVGGDVHEAQRRNPVASAYAAPLAIGGGVCAYTPVSGAGQFVSFGLSGSAAKIDKGCETRATADMFARLGMGYEACLIMVSQPAAVAALLDRASCLQPLDLTEAAPQPAPSVPVLQIAPEEAGERG